MTFKLAKNFHVFSFSLLCFFFFFLFGNIKNSSSSSGRWRAEKFNLCTRHRMKRWERKSHPHFFLCINVVKKKVEIIIIIMERNYRLNMKNCQRYQLQFSFLDSIKIDILITIIQDTCVTSGINLAYKNQTHNEIVL